MLKEPGEEEIFGVGKDFTGEGGPRPCNMGGLQGTRTRWRRQPRQRRWRDQSQGRWTG